MEQNKKNNIPFNKPFIDQTVADYLHKVFDSGKLSGDGVFCKEVETELERLFGMKHALLTTSCTHAMEIATMILDLKPGDEVIVPSFTFVSTANAVLRAGGTPVFCEINDKTFTLEPSDLEKRITSKTKAIFPVHYAGVSAEMDEILSLAKAHNLYVIEDAAQGVNAKYKGKYLGTIGHMGAYSFHDTKNYVSGEGGAFITNDEAIARRAEIIREKGTNRANFLRGEVDKYTWVDCGSSYVLSDILAAVLRCQLDKLEQIQQRRKQIHNLYVNGLKELEQRELLRLPIIPEYYESNYHIFCILLRNEDERNRLMKNLKEAGVGATFHYIPLHSSPYAVNSLGTKDIRLPVTDRVASTLLRLPIYPHLSDEDVFYVIENVKKSIHHG
ncbi:MAG: dTDP-4-amino-4,6-dideoxygalactose transaminase [Ignavibacteriae bacterium]|nr:dTDP-4-amino-4,6-dideoxygalactose transaminase [Ignavibacteriota bacterium]